MALSNWPGKVKVLYIIGTLDLGGTEKQLVHLVKGIDQSRFEVSVCCLSHGGSLTGSLIGEGFRVEVIGFRGFRQDGRGYARNLPRILTSFSRLVALIREESPHIVHSFLFWAYILGTYAAKAAMVPIVVSSRRSLGLFKERKWHYLFLERLANRMTDLIVANSEAVKQDVVRQEKVEPSRVRVIYNGIDPSLYDVLMDPTLRVSLSIPEEARVVGVVANLIHYKGHRFFLQACQEIKRKHHPVRFLLIGDGPLRGELEALVKELHLEEEVLFLGSRQDIPQLLTLMDVAVLPSLEEGFPNAVLEAMAAGKAVVATWVGGIPEAVIHGKTGLLVPPKDSQALAAAIIELLSDPPRSEEMGKAGRERVRKEFGLDRMVRDMEGLYEELVARKLQGKVRP